MSDFIESLESRRLLSAVPHKADSATVLDDKNAIANLKQQIKIDTASEKTRLALDKAAVPAARATSQNAIAAARIKLKQDKGSADLVTADKAAIVAAKASLKAAVTATTATIAQDRGAYKITLNNDKLALKQAELKLSQDRKAHL